MSRFTAKQNFSHADAPKLGVLLANLGTPDAPTPGALRKYLGQFLADPRIVEIPRLLWRIILHGIVLRVRPAKSAKLYEQIWTQDGSPLLVYAQAQAEGVRQRLQDRLEAPVAVELAMRYGQPSTPSALRRLREQGVERLVILPLYPQYSGATTASSFDAVADEFTRWRWLPEFRFIAQYHDRRAYIDCLTNSIREHWQQHDRGEKLLFSFHGTPKRYLLAGDPYHCQCHKTARLVAEQLELGDDAWQVSFQSRFGKAAWLQPYTDATIEGYGKAGIKNIDVIPPIAWKRLKKFRLRTGMSLPARVGSRCVTSQRSMTAATIWTCLANSPWSTRRGGPRPMTVPRRRGFPRPPWCVRAPWGPTSSGLAICISVNRP